MKMKTKVNNQKNNIYWLGSGIVGIGSGNIGILGILTFSDLTFKIRKVGAKVQDKDIKKDGNRTTVFFQTQKDVNSMITRLEKIKVGMKKTKISVNKTKKGKKK